MPVSPAAPGLDLDTAFAALGDPVRRALVARLARGDASVGELAEPFDLTPQAISHHVGVLRQCGLIEQRREGTRRPCRLRIDQLTLLGAWIDEQRATCEQLAARSAPQQPRSGDSIQVELQGDELIAERSFSSAPERVWVTFTTPVSIAAFWGGSHAAVHPESVTVDLRPGGEFALDTLEPGGATRRLRFVYVSVAEPYELVFDERATGLRTTVTISPADKGSKVSIHQRPLPPELRTAHAADGLASVLALSWGFLTADVNGLLSG